MVTSSDWWVVTIGYGESLCGEEDVYGRLCENACETTTERPYTVEGVVVRVERLALGVPLPVSTAVALSTVVCRPGWRRPSSRMNADAAATYIQRSRPFRVDVVSLGRPQCAVDRAHRIVDSIGFDERAVRPMDCAPRANRCSAIALLGRRDGAPAMERVPGPGAAGLPVPTP